MANKEHSTMGNQGGSKNPGNFANDREKASEAGRKGGQSSSTGQQRPPSESGRKGGRS